MKNRLGITEGKVYAIDFAGFYRILDGEFYENKDLLDKSETPDKEVESNTKLIVNAFETANKTGLLPSELLEQRDALLKALEEINGMCADASNKDDGKLNIGRVAKISIKAIKSIEDGK